MQQAPRSLGGRQQAVLGEGTAVTGSQRTTGKLVSNKSGEEDKVSLYLFMDHTSYFAQYLKRVFSKDNR